MKIYLGSENKAKVKALENVAKEFFEEFKVETLEVKSPDQPMSIEEAMKGARKRARQAYQEEEGSLGVGIEGYVETLEGRAFLSVWTSIYDGDDFYEGGSGRSELPEKITDMLEEMELGDAIMELMGEDLREGRGAISLLTEGATDRPEFTERSLIHAFGSMENRW